MLKKFSVGNFLSFESINTLSLEAKKSEKEHPDFSFSIAKSNLLKSAVIYGANASGKSNLIKALHFFKNFILNPPIQSIEGKKVEVEPFLLREGQEKKPSHFEIEFIDGNEQYTYGFEVSPQRIESEWLIKNPNKVILFRRIGQKFTIGSSLKGITTKEQESTRENVLFLSMLAVFNHEIAEKLLSKIRKIEILSGLERGATLDYSIQQFLEDPEQQKAMMELMVEADFGIDSMNLQQKQIPPDEFIRNMPPQFRDILLSGSPSQNFLHRQIQTLHKRFDKDGKETSTTNFDFFKESDGTQQMFCLTGLFLDTLKEGKVLIIDELDSSLHPLLCQFITKLFHSQEKNSKNAQLVFTTHDISMLDKDFFRRDQIWFTEKDKMGASGLFSLSELGERKEVSFSKRYLEGRYGALPYIKTLESDE